MSTGDPHTYSIRAARPTDLDALVALEEGVFDYDRVSRRQYRRHLAGTSVLLRVAVERGQLLGSGMVFLRAGTSVARLYSLAAAPKARGRGVGARLLVTLERAARRRGCKRMRLEVRTDNAGAIALYERQGYRRLAVRRGYYEDGADAFCYEKALSATSRLP